MSQCEHVVLSPNGEHAVQCLREANSGTMCWQHKKHDQAARQRALVAIAKSVRDMAQAQAEDRFIPGLWTKMKSDLADYLAAGGKLED